MKGVGLREIMALVSLVAAVVIAAQFLDPSASESKADPTVVHLGGPPESPTPHSTRTPIPTPTPQPAQIEQPADGWLVEFFEDGFDRPTDQSFVPGLDFTFPRAPFPDYKDDRWSLRATAHFQVLAGMSRFQLRHSGDVKVSVDGQVVATDAGSNKILDVRFEHTAGAATVVIEAKDSGGAFQLTWVAK